MMNADYERGVLLYKTARYQEALQSFSRTLETFPNDIDVQYYQALCYLMLDQPEKAKEIGFSILTLSPDDGHVHYLLSKIYSMMDDMENAQSHIETAINVDPYEAEFFGQKAALLLQQKKYAEGIPVVNEGLSLDPNNRNCLNIKAQLLTKLNRKEEASIITETLLDTDPENVYSHANIGWVELENGNHTKAFEHFSEALRIDPNFGYAREGMSTALKAKNILYRNYLKYAFWMSKKSSGQQWIIIIAIYLIYRFSAGILSAINMDFLLIPLIILYMFFALGSWMMESISNAILLTSTYGKYLLGTDERNSGIAFSTLLALAIICIVSYLFLDLNYLLTLSLAFFVALVPVPRAFLEQSQNSKLLGFIAGIIMIFLGAAGFLFLEGTIHPSFAIIITLVAFTWISNFVK